MNKAFNWQDYISVDPNVCHGQPCFTNTRIMVYLVLELLEDGIGIDEILSDYYPKLTKDSIKAALHYAAEIIKTEEYVCLT